MNVYVIIKYQLTLPKYINISYLVNGGNVRTSGVSLEELCKEIFYLIKDLT